MKVLVKIHPGIGHVELIDMPEPTIGEGQVIIEVKAAGICGTGTHIYNDEYGNDPPVILGHEISGEVVEVDATVTRFKAGDRVTINQPLVSSAVGVVTAKQGPIFL